MTDFNKNNITIIDIFSKVFSYWKILIVSALISGTAFFIYFKMKKVTYEATAVLFLDFSKDIITKFGGYTPLNNNSADYLKFLTQKSNVKKTIENFSLNMSESEFSNKISFDLNKSESSTSADVSIKLPYENVDNILSFHINNFVDSLVVYQYYNALDFFELRLNDRLENLMRDQENLLNIISSKDSVINQTSVTDLSVYQLNKLNQQGFEITAKEFFNPEYYFMSRELANLKAQLWKVERNIQENKQLKSELYEIENSSEPDDLLLKEELFDKTSFVNIFISPEKRSFVNSGSLTKNSLLGGFIGFILALFFVLITIVVKYRNQIKL